jgi:hypothetical protein
VTAGEAAMARGKPVASPGGHRAAEPASLYLPPFDHLPETPSPNLNRGDRD